MSERKTLNRQTAKVTTTYPERVVQFGAGNFIRAFADWMIQVLNDRTDFAGSVVVVKVTPHSKYDALDKQDGLFHVHTEGIENGALVSRTELIHCIDRTVYPYYNYDIYRQLARQPEIRFLISNTTESGIQYNESDRLEDQPPSSFPAKLTQFLYERFQHFRGAGDKGCIILPTELVADNGTQLKQMVLHYANQWQLETEFSHWVEEHNIFCNTLVDRIVPGYPEEKSAEILDAIGFEDALLVMGEPYHSFIIDVADDIKNELPFHKTALNVKFVDNVDRYRMIKVRILNGLHTSMVPIGYLLGLETVRECIEHPLLGKFLRDEANQEIIPSMDLPEDELQQFSQTVFDRFRNPSVDHLLMSIATNSSTKIKTRLFPTLLAYHQKYDALPYRVVLAIAAHICFYRGCWQGESVKLNDDPDIIQWFADLWQSSATTDELVSTVLKNTALWDTDLTQITGLHQQLTRYITLIEQDDLSALITELNG